MYIGRFLVVTPAMAAYRVSSRSFPERKIITRDNALAVVPTESAEATDNPYISYHCCRIAEDSAVIGNGSHVDPIAEKLEIGYPARDAITLSLLAMDYEKDSYNTPRIAAIIGESPLIGIVRNDAILVETVDEPTLVATYEEDRPRSIDMNWTDVSDAASGVLHMDYEHPVCAAAVARTESGFATAIDNSPPN